MLFCPALTDQISLFEFWLCGVRRNLVICYCQEGVDKACSEFTCDSSTPYSLPSSGPRALLNSVGFCMADLLPLPCSPVLNVEHRSSFIGLCSHQASVCVLLWYVEYLVFLWPYFHIFLLGSLYLLSEEEKKKYNLKVENYALFGGQTEDLSPEDRISALRDFSIEVREKPPSPILWPGESPRQRRLVDCSPWGHKESDMTEVAKHSTAREEPRFIGILQQRPGSQCIRKLLLTKENQTSQVNEFSTSLCMGRCKSLGSLKSVLSYAPQLSGARILGFLIQSPFRVHHWGWLQSLTAWWQASCFHSWIPSWLTIRGGSNEVAW